MLETLVFVGYVGSVVGLVFLFRWILSNSGNKILQGDKQGDEREPSLVKKYYAVDMAKYSSLFFNLGLAISVAASLTAFEWKTYETKLVELTGQANDSEEAMTAIVTEVPPPPPPPQQQVIQQPEIVEVKNDTQLQDIKMNLSVETDATDEVKTPVKVQIQQEEEPKEEEKVEEIFTVVEENAEPEGGMEAFLKYVKKELKYPKQARKMGVEGKVFVQFVVDKNGSITDVTIMKGIGAGCDEEAQRVLQEAPKWKPGKQRGKAVKVRVVFPIVFKLG